MARAFEVTTPLGDGVLLFRRMTVTEELGRMFEIDLELLSKQGDIKLADLLGQGITVKAELPAGGERYFHGLVSRFVQEGMLGNYYAYRATLRPWLWFLTRTADCKIYQTMTVPNIVKQVFGDQGFSDYDLKLNGQYTQWDYRVQYRETAFAFVSRLMEREGIYYFFKHEQGKHTLVLCDGPSSHAKTSGYETVPYYPPSPRAPRAEHVWQWQHWQEVQPVKTSLTDYDFTRPATSLLAQLNVSRQHALSKGEIFDYPGDYQQNSDGDAYVKVRLDEWSAQYEQSEGRSNARGLSAGALFSLSGFPRDDQNREYLIVATESSMHSNIYETGATQKEGPTCECRLRAISNAQTFRPPRITPAARVQGPQTAVVVGPSGEEIYTDQYGRIKVQFFWDRVGQKNENSSCWVRVGQSWAGKTWGAIFIPRIGQEVIVDFLEGDPDQPIVTGSVYNAEQMPPYALAGKMTQSGIKTRSTKQGTIDNFNELRFEDKKGSEEVFFHAERNFTREVENDDVLAVGLENDGKGNLQVGQAGKASGNQTITIFNNQTLTVGKKVGGTAPGDGSQTIEIWKNQTVTIGKGGSACQDGSQTASIFKDQTVTIGNNMTLNVGDSNAADGSQTVNIWKSRTVTLKSGDDTLTVTQGNQTVQIKAGASSLEAMQSILLKVGDNSIKIAPDGITIKGMLIDIQGSLGFKAKGLTADLAADAALTLKGAIAKIN
jgi:type VI secretion system secreted protein VgrG